MHVPHFRVTEQVRTGRAPRAPGASPTLRYRPRRKQTRSHHLPGRPLCVPVIADSPPRHSGYSALVAPRASIHARTGSG
jgi:hypothetical protein